MGVHSEDSLEPHKMYKLLIASLLAVATSLPIEDTADVAAAKAEFNAAFAAAEAGEHAALAPVNADTQAAQIAAEYLADAEEVAAAKAAFQAAYDDAAAGGLAAKQEPAPVHENPVPAPLTVAAAPGLAYPYASALNALPAAYPYGLAHAGLGYAGLGYAGLGYAGLDLLVLATLMPVCPWWPPQPPPPKSR